jgi:MoaA/NifB/PqqE/SkfB family radical SAM enzyme
MRKVHSDPGMSKGIQHWRYRTEPEEVLWQFCPEQQCPFSCEHCMARTTSQTELPLEQKLMVLDKLLKAGVSRLAFTGGEPLLHPDLPSLLGHTKVHRNTGTQMPRIIICTTGVGFCSQLAASIKDASETLRISLHRLHDNPEITSIGPERAAELIHQCNEHGIPVIVNSLVLANFSLTLQHLIRFLQLHSSIECWNILAPYVTMGFGIASPLFPRGDDWLAAQRLLSATTGLPVRVSGLVSDRLENICRGAWHIVFVDTEGRIAKCVSDAYERSGTLLNSSFTDLYREAFALGEGCCKANIRNGKTGIPFTTCGLHDERIDQPLLQAVPTAPIASDINRRIVVCRAISVTCRQTARKRHYALRTASIPMADKF